jgi:hypothetical protein
LENGWLPGAGSQVEFELHVCKLPTVWITPVDNHPGEARRRLAAIIAKRPTQRLPGEGSAALRGRSQRRFTRAKACALYEPEPCSPGVAEATCNDLLPNELCWAECAGRTAAGRAQKTPASTGDAGV